MFGQTKPATAGFGGGFGAPPTAPSTSQGPAGGGFGFSRTNTSTNLTSAGTSGWGAAPTATPAATTTGWGAPPQPQATALGSWGAPQQQAPAANAWGAQPPQMPQQQLQPFSPPPNYVPLQDFTRQSALASFLMELDKAYDALGPKCRFRAFVYNSCPPGQMVNAVQKERYIAFLNGGGVPEEEWMKALQENPEPGRMFPQPLHFAQELQQRCDKQKTELKRLTDLADGYLQDVETVAAIDEANKNRLKVLRQEDVMLRRRWYLLQQKLEVLSRWGQRSGEESLLLRQVEQLRLTLAAPGRFRDALHELEPLLDTEAERCAEQQRAVGSVGSRPLGGRSEEGDAAAIAAGGLLRSHVDGKVVEGWISFAKQMQDGIQSLHGLLERNSKDMIAIRERATQ